ncbi:hypothetical protein [Mycolicibacterium fortuitum]|uniref:hypothetical protein n=1 Tax=Mycolicibacterium fortuitum TaxID=1766 RepID=UPI003AB03EEE
MSEHHQAPDQRFTVDDIIEVCRALITRSAVKSHVAGAVARLLSHCGTRAVEASGDRAAVDVLTAIGLLSRHLSALPASAALDQHITELRELARRTIGFGGAEGLPLSPETAHGLLCRVTEVGHQAMRDARHEFG